MKIFCKNTATGLIPLYDSDLAEKKKLKLGEIYEMAPKLWKERNLQFHKKFFALVNLGCENSPKDWDIDGYRAWVTMLSGWVDVYETEKGKMAIAKSISFDNMDNDEFAKLYNSAIQVIINDIGATEQEIEQNLINFM